DRPGRQKGPALLHDLFDEARGPLGDLGGTAIAEAQQHHRPRHLDRQEIGDADLSHASWPVLALLARARTAGGIGPIRRLSAARRPPPAGPPCRTRGPRAGRPCRAPAPCPRAGGTAPWRAGPSRSPAPADNRTARRLPAGPSRGRPPFPAY